MYIQQEIEPRTKEISAWDYVTDKMTHHFKVNCKERWQSKQAKKKITNHSKTHHTKLIIFNWAMLWETLSRKTLISFKCWKVGLVSRALSLGLCKDLTCRVHLVLITRRNLHIIKKTGSSNWVRNSFLNL